MGHHRRRPGRRHHHQLEEDEQKVLVLLVLLALVQLLARDLLSREVGVGWVDRLDDCQPFLRQFITLAWYLNVRRSRWALNSKSNEGSVNKASVSLVS